MGFRGLDRKLKSKQKRLKIGDFGDLSLLIFLNDIVQFDKNKGANNRKYPPTIECLLGGKVDISFLWKDYPLSVIKLEKIPSKNRGIHR